MKTVNALCSITLMALCCSTAALAEQTTAANAAALAPAGCEEVIITAQRVSHLPAISATQRSALRTSVNAETRKVIRQSMEQFIAHAAKTLLPAARNDALQASL